MHLDSHKITVAACMGMQQQKHTAGIEPGDCDAQIDACGVRAHALSEWRLEPPP